MTDLIKSSLQEINEIVLITGQVDIPIPSASPAFVTTVAHNIGRTPYYSYKISFDKTTFLAPPFGQLGDDRDTFMEVYVDSENIYFRYSGTRDGFTFYIQYKLFLVESV